MSVELATAYVSIVPSAKGMGAAIGKELGGPVEQAAGDAGKKAGGILSSTLGKAAAIGGGLLAANELKNFLGSTIDAARESNKVAAQTAQVVKSTGGAANLTADQFADLATAISKNTGVDDEAVQSAENLLATFTNVQNRVGKGNDVFNKATQAIVDMSAVQGDLQSNSILVGKALQDPVQGVSALQRVGVKLTDQQKEQVKAMVATGDVAGAQGIILKELATEFGGQAAAQATASDKLKVTLGNLQEDLGNKLIPILDKTATWLANNLPGAIDAAGKAFGTIRRIVGPVIAFIAEAWKNLAAGFKEGGVFEDATGAAAVFQRIGAVAQEWLPKITDAMRDVTDFVKRNFKPILLGIAILLSPAAVAIGLLIAAFIKFKGVRQVVVGTLDAIGEAISGLVGFVVDLWPQISEAATHVFNVLKAIVETVLTGISAFWSVWGDDLLKIVRGVFDVVRAYIEEVINVIAGIIRFVLAVINGDWGKAWDALKDIAKAVIDGIVGVVRGFGTILSGLLGGIANTIATGLSAAWGTFKRLGKDAIDAVVGFVAGLPGRVFGLLGSVAGIFQSLGAKMLEGLTKGIAGVGAGALGLAEKAADLIGDMARGLLNAVIRAINHMIPDSIGKVSVLGHTIFPGLDLPDDPIPIIKAANGFDGIVTKPTMFLAAEAGAAERVTIGPASGGAPLIGHLEVKGQDQPRQTVREIVYALRKAAVGVR
jgi:phage-related protein